MKAAAPPRGFGIEEYEQRTDNAQRRMARDGVDALLLTTEADIRYFTGFLTAFWQSPTRPWFLVIPSAGKPVAVIPEIGRECMAACWIDDIRTWPAPRFIDDGISLLADLLHVCCLAGGAVGTPMGPESHLRMPLDDYMALRDRLANLTFCDATPVIRDLRMLKSEAEIAKLRHICGLVSDGFANLASIAAVGVVEREIFRRFRIDLLSRGADDVPYLVGGSGPDGPRDIISPPSGRSIAPGDILMMDTGAVFDGYYCDFDRNVGFVEVTDEACRAYDTVYRATEAGLRTARPGATSGDLWAAMAPHLEDAGSGRFGHGLGMQLTEPPSNMKDDATVMQPGMVMTLEPALAFGDGGIMVHEENLVIRDGPPELLTQRASRDIPVLM